MGLLGTVSRRVFMSAVPVVAGRMAAAALRRERVCVPFNGAMSCDARIPTRDFNRVRATQQTLVWCWAATLEMIFRWHGRPISQAGIVSQTFGGLVAAPANPMVLINAVNRSYVGEDGRRFTVRARVWGPDYGANEVDNRAVIASLSADRPMVVCNTSHMMTLIGLHYLEQGSLIRPLSAWVADPMLLGPVPPPMGESQLPPGFRYLLPAEMVPVTMGGQLRFLADLRVA